MPTQQPGPKPGRSPGSRRNTGAQQASYSSASGPYAALSAAQAAMYTSQEAGLQDQYSLALAAIRQQRGQTLAQAKIGRADVKANAISSMGSTEGEAAQRGIVGSSVDAVNRSGVLQERARGLIEVAAAKGDALAQLKLQKLNAQSALNTGVADIEAQKRAAQMEIEVQQYQMQLQMQQAEADRASYEAALARLTAKRGGPSRGQNPTAAAVPQNSPWTAEDVGQRERWLRTRGAPTTTVNGQPAWRVNGRLVDQNGVYLTGPSASTTLSNYNQTGSL